MGGVSSWPSLPASQSSDGALSRLCPIARWTRMASGWSLSTGHLRRTTDEIPFQWIDQSRLLRDSSSFHFAFSWPSRYSNDGRHFSRSNYGPPASFPASGGG